MILIGTKDDAVGKRQKIMNLSQIVTNYDTRGRSDRLCLYCKNPVGTSHKEDCVAFRKTVVIETTIQHVVTVPVNWSPESTVSFYLESSHCGDNFVQDIAEFRDCLESCGECLCTWITDVKFIRDVEEKYSQLW